MRHNKKFNHLGRKKGHREALLKNLTISLIMHKRINTTLAKAKALRMYAEPLINFSAWLPRRWPTVPEVTPASSRPDIVLATTPRWQ